MKKIILCFCLLGVSVFANDYEKLSAIQNQQEEAERLIQMAKTRLEEEKKDLYVLRFINQTYCARLQQLRSECAPLMRLMPDPSEKTLACVGNTDSEVAQAYQYMVGINGLAGGQARFVAKSQGLTYITNWFPEGQHPLQWSHQESNDMTGLAPRMIEVTDLRLEIQGASKNVSLFLTINKNNVFTNYSLNHGLVDKGAFLNVNLSELHALQQSSKCKVSQTEIDQLTTQAKLQAEKEYEATIASTPVNNATTEYIAKRLFASIFGRLPLLSSGEGFQEEPLSLIMPHLQKQEWEMAAQKLILSTKAKNTLGKELEPITQEEMAEKVAYKIFVGLTGTPPDEEVLKQASKRVLQGERVKIIVEVLSSSEFQKTVGASLGGSL